MKKIKALAAFLLALTFIAPLATLQACENESAELTPPESGAELPSEEETETPDVDGDSADDDNQEAETPQPTPEPKPEPEPEPEPIVPSVTYAKYIRCTGESVNIRSGAGTSYSTLGTAEKNTSYAVVGRSGNWYKTYYRGKTAYLYASYAAVFELEESEKDAVEDVIAEGYKLIGVPYVYGAVRLHDGKGKLLAGFTAQKFDCSSLIQYVFYQGAGKLLDVNTRTQIKQGKYVAPSDLQRGDCIFFTNESRQHLTGIERVGHVALYLGNNYILHTASDYARIEKISAARWSFYVEARRFI
ncbi:MAG: C40 family peptidase [Clostridia bacterium]|nr:C40 family peptidase [Clostridia bacterium]